VAREQVLVEVRSEAPPETVFALVADGARWPSCTPLGSFALEPPATVDGVGAVRIFRTGLVTAKERVVASEPPRHFAYELVSGLPIRDYRADVDLEPDGGGTRIAWRCSFTPKLPATGWLFRAFLRTVLRSCACGIALGAASG
jgi:hypothetical protein